MERVVELKQSVEKALTDHDSVGVGLLGLALLTFAFGYAGGSVLAGESLDQQRWLVWFVPAIVAPLLALSRHESSEKR